MLSRLSYKAEQFEPSQEALANWFCAPGPSTQFLEIRSEMAPGWLAWPHLTRAPILGAKEALRVGQGGGAGRRGGKEERRGREERKGGEEAQGGEKGRRGGKEGGQGGEEGREGGGAGKEGLGGGTGREERKGGRRGREEGHGRPQSTSTHQDSPQKPRMMYQRPKGLRQQLWSLLGLKRKRGLEKAVRCLKSHRGLIAKLELERWSLDFRLPLCDHTGPQGSD